MTDIRASIWKVYIYRFLSEFYLIVPILIPYYEFYHLNSTQIFTICGSISLKLILWTFQEESESIERMS